MKKPPKMTLQGKGSVRYNKRRRRYHLFEGGFVVVDLKELRKQMADENMSGVVGFSNRGACTARLRNIGIAWGEAVLFEEGKWLGMREWYACFIDSLYQSGYKANATFREFSSHLQKSPKVEKRFVRKGGHNRREYRHIDVPVEEE